jgi:hypothetical protein
VKATQLSVKSLTDNLVITNRDSPNEGIRANSTPPALRKLKRPREVRSIRGCELRIHATD